MSKTASAFTTISICSACGARNRVPAAHLASTGRCGSCRGQLDPLSRPIEVDEFALSDIVESAPVPVLVDFWAAWCGPCRAAAPEVAKLADKLAGRVIVVKVDTEAHPDLAVRYGVRGIPNFQIFHRGRVVFQHAGAVSSGEMQRWLLPYLR